MKISVITGIMFVFLWYGCTSDAPRDNPLDPVNGVQITGKVERLYDNTGINNAMLVLKPINKTAISALDGSFAMDNISPGNYTLVCQAGGFAPDSLALDIQQSHTANFRLNGRPFFRSISVTTHHISSFSAPNDSFFVLINAAADDLDNRGDVRLVRYAIEAFNFTDTLFEANSQEKIFSSELRMSDLGISSLQQLAGKPFVFYVEDLPGAVFASNEVFITRIIEETPVGQAPLNAAISGQGPINFEWLPVSQPYSFTFDIEIRRINFSFFILVGEVKNIPPADTTAAFGGDLIQGEYFWTLFITDEFGNRSRSLENPFIVQ